MGFSFNSLVPEFTDEYITVRSASEFSGYNQQYLRRLLRKGVLKTRKIGQIWLIDQRDFKDYLKEANQSKDKRFGPQI
jgi:excisionase family DNA binding protein